MEESQRRTLARLEAFSDGVFAIAATLLVLTLHVPDITLDHITSGGALWVSLARQWPSFAAYLASFLFILIMWLNHHDFFTMLTHSDRAFAMLNGGLLLLVSFVPFPTALVAQYLLRSNSAANVAAGIYGGTYVLLSIMFTAMRVYAGGRGKLMRPDVPQIPPWQNALGIAMYGVCALLAVVSPILSIGASVCVSLLYILPGTWGVSSRHLLTEEHPSDSGVPK